MSKEVVIELKLGKKEGMVRSLADVKAGFDMIYGASKKVAGVFDEMAERGAKFDALMRNNTISIDEAARATGGYVTKMQLLQSANTAAEFRLGMTGKEFAKFAQFATLQAQKLGGDANKMLDDLIRGTARGSRMILDNLGLIVKEGASVQDVTKAINSKMGDQAVEVKTAGEAWLVFKSEVSNAVDEMSRATSGATLIRDAIGQLSFSLGIVGDTLKSVGVAFGDMSTAGVRAFRTLAANVRFIPGLEALGDLGLKSTALAEKAMKSAGKWEGGAEWVNPAGWLAAQAGPKASEKKGTKKAEAFGPANVYQYSEEGGHAESAFGEETIDIQATTRGMDDGTEAIVRQVGAWQELGKAVAQGAKSFDGLNKNQIEYLKTTGIGVVADFGGSLWAAADAAIMGADSFGMAMAKMLKSTLLSIAQESTIKAIFNLAEAAAQWFNPVAVSSHLTAAALYGSVAVAAGAAGLGVSAGIKSGGGYDKKAKEQRQSSSGGGSRTTFGTRTNDTTPININVYIGDPGNPSTAILLTKQIEAKIKKAA